MKKKDLRERLVDIMHYDGTYSTSDLVKFIQQELNRAREEMIMEIYNFVEGESGRSGRKEILEFISKLTTK